MRKLWRWLKSIRLRLEPEYDDESEVWENLAKKVEKEEAKNGR